MATGGGKPTKRRYNSTLTPEVRSAKARYAALVKASKVDGGEATRKAREAFLFEKFEKQVDPDGVLPLDERERRADAARKAYFLGLSIKRQEARQRARELLELADSADAELNGLAE